MRAKRTQYRAPTIGSGMEATIAPNFPVYCHERLYNEKKVLLCNKRIYIEAIK